MTEELIAAIREPFAGDFPEAAGHWRALAILAADALEAATAETEWEYNTRAANGFLYSPCTLADAVAAVESSKQIHVYPGSETLRLVRHVVRRRAAGPWEPVGGESA